MNLMFSMIVLAVLVLYGSSFTLLRSRKRWVFIAALIANVLVVLTLVRISNVLGEVNSNIMQGSPAYFVLADVSERVASGDHTVSNDLQALVEKLDPKNAGGVNGAILSDYIEKRRNLRGNEGRYTHSTE